MNETDLTREEQSLLLYIESCAVDCQGRLDIKKINESERQILAKWAESGLISWGRICSDDITPNGHQWVNLSDQAHVLAAKCRMERAKRNWTTRKYRTTAESRGE